MKTNIKTDAGVVLLLQNAKRILHDDRRDSEGFTLGGNIPQGAYPFVDRQLGLATAQQYRQRGFLAASAWLMAILAYQEMEMRNAKKAYTYACRAYELFNLNFKSGGYGCDLGERLQDAKIPAELHTWWLTAIADCYNRWPTTVNSIRKPWQVWVDGVQVGAYKSSRAAIGRAETEFPVAHIRTDIDIEIRGTCEGMPGASYNPFTYMKNLLKYEKRGN